MGAERGLVEEYVEKMPNPSLKGERRGAPRRLRPEAAAGPGRAGAGRRRGLCRPTFKPVDLSDLKRRNAQDAKKS
ncbi:Mapk-regulated corepressor-interacting protein 1 [Aix galericulata]|nr:Mapk-regulated corepressor-interacting protein 1 [Aix galericulata]